MKPQTEAYFLKESKAALRRGDRTLARQYAQKLVSINPKSLEGWLILGGISSPKASQVYLEKARNLAPEDPRVIAALTWVEKRIATAPKDDQEETRKTLITPAVQATTLRPPIVVETHRPVWLWTLLALAALAVFMLVIDMIPAGYFNRVNRAAPIYAEGFIKPSLTATATFTPTPTSTPTNTPTATPTFTPTPTFTSTPTSTWTPTPWPTNTPQPVNPPVSGNGERWIDIVLSEQRLYAYEGDTVVGSFLVSTGLPNTPTLVGTYAVYVKLRWTDMAGPGYYLPNVPFTMYYYKGYGIHGTYWHNNFGTPMSHGCVNMLTEEAEWLYNWSHVGIVVNVRH